MINVSTIVFKKDGYIKNNINIEQLKNKVVEIPKFFIWSKDLSASSK